MSASCLWPNREPVREYGRAGWLLAVDGREVVVFDSGFLAGVTPRPGVLVLAERFRAGVGRRSGAGFLNGDSGRGRDGRFGLKVGLEGRAPGPTDCENLSPELAGGARCPLTVLYDGVLGVTGKESRDTAGESRFSARCTGKNMPEPGIDVLKYCVLDIVSAYTSLHARYATRIPIHVSVILAPSRELSGELYAHELPTLASDGAHESDSAKHVARHIDRVSNLQIGDFHAGGSRCCRSA